MVVVVMMMFGKKVVSHHLHHHHQQTSTVCPDVYRVDERLIDKKTMLITISAAADKLKRHNTELD